VISREEALRKERTMDNQRALDRHRKLIEEGWLRRFTAEEPRLSEMKQFYECLGLEVLVEAGTPDEDGECTSCFDLEGFQERYKTIYTRGEESQGQGGSDDLFE
jgi:hypothetical protein